MHKRTYHKAYRHLINNHKWTKLRRAYIAQHPLCERCLSEGRTKPADEVHHIEPLENYLAQPEVMKRLAYDPSNLMSVCTACHGKIHSELMSRSREAHRARAKARTQRFIETYLEQV